MNPALHWCAMVVAVQAGTIQFPCQKAENIFLIIIMTGYKTFDV